MVRTRTATSWALRTSYVVLSEQGSRRLIQLSSWQSFPDAGPVPATKREPGNILHPSQAYAVVSLALAVFYEPSLRTKILSIVAEHLLIARDGLLVHADNRSRGDSTTIR